MNPLIAKYLAWVSIAGATTAFSLLAVAPLGWRLGVWHFRTAFYRLMATSAYLAGGSALASVAAIGLGWNALEAPEFAGTGIALALGLMLTYVPWQYKRTLERLPKIHDITTDTVDPPPFQAVLAAREAESASPATYEGEVIAKQQRAAYPDLGPLETPLAPQEAFRHALQAAERMPNWTLLAQDGAAGRIEATQKSRWFGFSDDIAIRVAANGSGSRIDMRSSSRQGRSDFGVNAARIRAYTAALKSHLR
jgi:uncharacterized protein (DUF1499 family)